ncbi:peptide chain release factor N(5)-glutamine methyltransferase [Lentibacillus saliphilus]|uniref:peptide chain release factor N(5)-glutamine methyltransferase n=1 Tax=Lentibacillus saliphilus TaxID=2737028 RepID=UPI0031BA3C6D
MTSSNKQYEVLQRASLFLQQHNREEAVATILLNHHLGVSRSAFYTMMREDVSEEIVRAFWDDVIAHAELGVPVQHLMGYANFYGRDFSVSSDVLIPRPETEELVQHVIQSVERNVVNEPVTIIDVGTGSGIIAITLALELKHAIVHATDISKEALQVAKLNAEQLGADVMFHEGHFLEPIITASVDPDIIVSNPPYIAHSEKQSLADTVKHFDPHLALFADHDGLAAYEMIIDQAQHHLSSVHSLAFEIGHDQAIPVTALLKDAYPHARVDTVKDINGKDRMIFACQQ